MIFQKYFYQTHNFLDVLAYTFEEIVEVIITKKKRSKKYFPPNNSEYSGGANGVYLLAGRWLSDRSRFSVRRARPPVQSAAPPGEQSSHVRYIAPLLCPTPGDLTLPRSNPAARARPGTDQKEIGFGVESDSSTSRRRAGLRQP